jgi:diguanylate cyclase (GGDEF)-like protein
MRVNLNAVPTLVALAVLVAVFAAIERHPTKERVRLWLAGWALVLLGTLAHVFRFRKPGLAQVELAAGLSMVALGSIAFVASVAPRSTTWRRQLVLGLVLGVPTLLYLNALFGQVSAKSFYCAVTGGGLAAIAVLLRAWYGKITLYVACMGMAATLLTGLVIWSIAVGHPERGIHTMLAALSLLAAALYWYRFRRPSAGVLTAVVGFVAWGLSFPAGILLPKFVPSVRFQTEIWNIPKYLVALGMIVTLLEEQIRQSEYLAYHDALTGLPNRRLLQDRLLQALARASRSGRKVAVLLLDLDDFKQVNDTYGHRMGDAALQAVVARLSTRMRASDTLARTGGDEFTIVSEVATAEGARTLASALDSALLLPLDVEGRRVRAGASVGYALYPDDGTDLDELCAAADRAMYARKPGVRLQ